MSNTRGVAALLVAVAVGAVGGHYLEPKLLGSFDTCMLSEMRGQSPGMGSHALRECSRRYKHPVDVMARATDYNWGPLGGTTVMVTSVSSEMVLTEAAFSTSPRRCWESTDADFSKPVRKTFDDGIAIVGSVPDPKCLRMTGSMGYYR